MFTVAEGRLDWWWAKRERAAFAPKGASASLAEARGAS